MTHNLNISSLTVKLFPLDEGTFIRKYFSYLDDSFNIGKYVEEYT